MPSPQYLFPGYSKLAGGASDLVVSAPTIAVTPGTTTVARSGSAPATPSAVTAPVVSYKVGVWAGNGQQYCPQSLYATSISSYNFHGHKGVIAYLAGYGASKTFKGSTAAGDSASGNYSLQRAFEGLPSSDNGSVTGAGLFKAKQAGTIEKAVVGFYLTATSGSADTTKGLFGDMSVTATRDDVCSKITDLVSFVEFIGGDGISMDWETGNWDALGGWANTAARQAGLEQFGYEVGNAIWGTFPGCELWIYNFQCDGSWHEYLNAGGPNGRKNADLPRVQFMFGLFRAHTGQNATGRIRWLDHQWYRAGSAVSGVSLTTALKYNTQGTLSHFSQDMPAASWSHISHYFDVACFHWAGTDSTGFYTQSQENEPAYTNGEEVYRQWSMGGWRFEYTGPDLTPDTLWFRNANRGLWNGHNDYTFPTGRQAKMIGSLASQSGTHSTTAPTLSGSLGTRVGGARPVNLTASHPYGIRCIDYKVFDTDGATVLSTGSFQMTWDLNGSTVTSGLTTDRMVVSQSVTVPAGGYVQATAWSTLSLPDEGLGQQRSLTLAA